MTIVRLIYFSLVLLCGSAVGANELSQDELTGVITQSQSSDYRAVTNAAKHLSHYPVAEAEDALVKIVLRSDVPSNNSSYPWALSAALESLEQIGTANRAAELDFGRQNITRIANQASTSHALLQKLDKALARMNTRILPLPRFAEFENRSTVAGGVSGASSSSPPTSLTASPTDSGAISISPLSELISKAEHTGNNQALAFDLIKQIDANLFDQAQRRRQRGKSPTSNKGREDELEKILQALLKIDKSHVLILGKAGIGKTRLLTQLQESWLSGALPYPGRNPPIVLELSILDVTNPHDPTIIKNRYRQAQALAQMLNSHVILFVDEGHASTDMTRQAIKGNLTVPIGEESSLVHFVWATTSTESRDFLGDAAFSRRWTQVHVEELSDDQAIEAIAIAYVPEWQDRHSVGEIHFRDVSREAYEFALKYSKEEQPHAGNPTGLKEILEASIVHKIRSLSARVADGEILSESETQVIIQPDDIRAYLKFQRGHILMPGDRDFDANFARLWQNFREEYRGQDGLAEVIRERLKSHFSTFRHENMLAIANFGPPGAGKSHLAEKLAQHFFNKALLPMNSGQFSEGGHPLNILIGSAPGTAQAEKQLGLLTKFISENPLGGVILFEEFDYLPQQVIDFIVDMISRKEFKDNLGQTWSTKNFVLLFNSNLGQDLMIPRTPGQPMTWEAFENRVMAATDTVWIDGHIQKVVRPDILSQIFDQFVKKVGRGRIDQHVDTGEILQNGIKLRRRIMPVYTLPPDRSTLREVARTTVQKFFAEQYNDFGVEFHLEDFDHAIDEILDLDNFIFENGFSYITQRIERFLTVPMRTFSSERGKVFKINVVRDSVHVGRRPAIGLKLIVIDADSSSVREISLGARLSPSVNQWANNPLMRDRIRNIVRTMKSRIVGHDTSIRQTAAELTAKLNNWDQILNITLLGAPQSGKTEWANALGEALFGSKSATKVITGIKTWGDLQTHFRSATGFVGSNEETDLEAWFKTRQNEGGGVLIFDGLLDVVGLSRQEISERIQIFHKLEDLLKRRQPSFRGPSIDARGFVVVITGNAFADEFAHVDGSPETDQEVRDIMAELTPDRVVNHLMKIGFDASTIAQFGNIHVNGPLNRDQTLVVSHRELDRSIISATQQAQSLSPIRVTVEPTLLEKILDRVSTASVGVKSMLDAIRAVLISPLSGILLDFESAEDITATLDSEQKVRWTVDGMRVEQVLDPEGFDTRWETIDSARGNITTPQISTIVPPETTQVTAENLIVILHHELYGHLLTSYLLTGKNQARSISLMPRGQALGYVRYDSRRPQDVSGLVALLTHMTVAQAGHRAVFLAGIRSVGAGGSPGQDPKARADDMARVDNLIESIVLNNLVANVREKSSVKVKSQLSELLSALSKRMADRTIRYGVQSKIFKPLYDELLKTRFADESRLKKFFDDIEANGPRRPDPELLFARVFGLSLIETFNDIISLLRNRGEREVLYNIAQDLLRSIMREIRSLRKLGDRERLSTTEESQLRNFEQSLAQRLSDDFNREERSPINRCVLYLDSGQSE